MLQTCCSALKMRSWWFRHYRKFPQGAAALSSHVLERSDKVQAEVMWVACAESDNSLLRRVVGGLQPARTWR